MFRFARLKVFETSNSGQVVQGFREEFGVLLRLQPELFCACQ